jgi:hypothetical protein
VRTRASEEVARMTKHLVSGTITLRFDVEVDGADVRDAYALAEELNVHPTLLGEYLADPDSDDVFLHDEDAIVVVSGIREGVLEELWDDEDEEDDEDDDLVGDDGDEDDDEDEGDDEDEEVEWIDDGRD